MATKLTIDSWRWAGGVPFYLRAGKYLPGAATEAILEFHRPPRMLFAGGEGATVPKANRIHLRLGHSDGGVTLAMQAKSPGKQTVTREVGSMWTSLRARTTPRSVRTAAR